MNEIYCLDTSVFIKYLCPDEQEILATELDRIFRLIKTQFSTVGAKHSGDKLIIFTQISSSESFALSSKIDFTPNTD